MWMIQDCHRFSLLLKGLGIYARVVQDFDSGLLRSNAHMLPQIDISKPASAEVAYKAIVTKLLTRQIRHLEIILQ